MKKRIEDKRDGKGRDGKGKITVEQKNGQEMRSLPSKCSISGKCGGCQYIDMDYADQLKRKQKYLNKLLSDFGKPEHILGMERPFFYRNKVHAVLHRTQKGMIYAGIYEEKTHNVLPVKKCYIENEKASEIIQTITELVKSFKLTVYNETSDFGLLRHVVVRVGAVTGEIMVVLVTTSPVFPSKNNFISALHKAHPEITTIVQNINDRRTTMVLGTRNIVMYGRGYIQDRLCGKLFRISPTSFYQVNPVQTEVLYHKAMELAGLTGRETVIDAYCGIGTIGIAASDKAAEVIGVELNSEAVKDARVNAKLNEIRNISFYNNDAGKFMIELAEQKKSVDVVFMDPPRSGSDEPFMNALLQLSPERIVYISCGPESLARDLTYLTKSKKYQVEQICPVDMFPVTRGIETVCLLSRRRNEKNL